MHTHPELFGELGMKRGAVQSGRRLSQPVAAPHNRRLAAQRGVGTDAEGPSGPGRAEPQILRLVPEVW